MHTFHFSRLPSSGNVLLDNYREDTGFLTNFPDEYLSKYQAAIAAYKKIAPEVLLEVGDGWRNSNYALYLKAGKRDLSLFWRIFESLTFKGTWELPS